MYLVIIDLHACMMSVAVDDSGYVCSASGAIFGRKLTSLFLILCLSLSVLA